MFNNYTLFKYGQTATSKFRKRKTSFSFPTNTESESKHKNKKERAKDIEHLKGRLEVMKTERQLLFKKLGEITSKSLKNN